MKEYVRKNKIQIQTNVILNFASILKMESKIFSF